MSRPFGKLARVLRCDEHAEEYIRSYGQCIARYSQSLTRRYPGEVDWEPVCFQALYEAAYTYQPGPQCFWVWLKHNVRGHVSSHRKRHLRRAKLRRHELKDVDEWVSRLL